MWRTFIQVFAVTLTVVASIFLLKGNLGLSISNIAELSKTRYGYSKEVARNLSHQRADTKTGLLFLLVALGFQMGNLLWPMRVVDFNVNVLGAVLAILAASLLFIVGWNVSCAIGDHTWNEVMGTLEHHK